MGAQLLKGSPRGMFAPSWAVDEGFHCTWLPFDLCFATPVIPPHPLQGGRKSLGGRSGGGPQP